MQNDETLPSAQPVDPAEQILAQRKAFETAVTLHAWSDAAFAEQLTQDPIAAINAAFDIELPADLDMQLHLESPTTLHLALPQAPVIASNSNELSDDDLERVAGGSALIATALSVLVSVSVTVPVSVHAIKQSVNAAK